MVILGLCAFDVQSALLPSREPEYFTVGGMLADDLTSTSFSGGKFFEAGIYQMPLVEPRRRVAVIAPPAEIPSGIEIAPAGRAAEALRSAEIFASSQEWRMALASVQAALDYDPDNLMLLRRAAAYAALARKFGVADEYFRRALARTPDDVAFLVGRAGVLLRLARLGEGEELANRALSIQPQYLAARFVKVCLQIARGVEAIDDAEWAALYTEQVAEMAQWLEADRKDYEAVMTTNGFRKACDVMLGPGLADRLEDVTRKLRKVVMELRARQWDQAKADLMELRQMGVRAVGIEMDIARCLFESGRELDAERLLGELAARYPNLAILQFNHAVALIRLRRYNEAIVALERSLSLDPKSNYTLFAMACAYAGLGEMDKAWSYMQRILPEYRGMVREWAEGDDAYLKAIREDPRFPDFIRSQEQ